MTPEQTVQILSRLRGTSPAIVFGHADADGHLAAEQSRTNIEAQGIRVDEVVVGPETRNYSFWERSFPSYDFTGFRLVVVVDIAFRFKDPDQSLKAVLEVADRHLETQFVVIDHHPIKQPATLRSNLTLINADTVYQCCVGTPSEELMVVAAICDGDGKAVESRTKDIHVKLADGVRRAAADIGGVAGPKLLELLKRRQWDFFEHLADEPSDFHRRVRGRRTARSAASPLLKAAMAGQV